MLNSLIQNADQLIDLVNAEIITKEEARTILGLSNTDTDSAPEVETTTTPDATQTQTA